MWQISEVKDPVGLTIRNLDFLVSVHRQHFEWFYVGDCHNLIYVSKVDVELMTQRC